ncbi:DUF4404 family protein [Undibacterium seohonense]|jgi:GTP-binding protein EngB required for normal cell division|uniref:DUF4404 family protein n=1 Tax=Undibacterium seohonense TaxID=1344950 RepID=A0ABR6X9E3_9BURK|nr:DUF4404 family protein [Undibacterium seohonense]MBC3809445.1 DUF4404 family protein [Undibacterium seohonense]
MKRDMLKGLLKQLQDGLHTTEQVDAEMKALLQDLHQDIEVVLAKDENPDDPLYAALSDRSRAIYAEFASKHPKLEPALRELGSMLEKMGV